MRESEIRQQIEKILRRRLQSMLAPALGVGLGLAAASCGGGGSEYGAQFPRGPDAAYGAPFPRDVAAVDTPMRMDGALDLAIVEDARVEVGQEEVPSVSGVPIDSGGEAAAGAEALPVSDAGNESDM